MFINMPCLTVLTLGDFDHNLFQFFSIHVTFPVLIKIDLKC